MEAEPAEEGLAGEHDRGRDILRLGLLDCHRRDASHGDHLHTLRLGLAVKEARECSTGEDAQYADPEEQGRRDHQTSHEWSHESDLGFSGLAIAA
jgi:hypothetical protein